MLIKKRTTTLKVNPPFIVDSMMEFAYDLDLEEGEEAVESEFGTLIISDESQVRPGLQSPVIIDGAGDVVTAAHDGDAGVDVTASEDFVVRAHTVEMVHTGFHLGVLPPSTVAFVCSRSGLAAKKGVFVANAPGVVDSGYEGEICVVLYNSSDTDFEGAVGTRIAQIAVLPCYPFVSGGGARGEGGFGSTGE